MNRARLLAVAILTAAVLAACGTAAANDATPAASAGPNAVHIVASNIAFTTQNVAAPAGTAFQIVFDNRDGAPHNVAILAADGSVVFTGDVFSGPAQRVYEVPALKAGTYHFRCDVHPDMTGTLVVR